MVLRDGSVASLKTATPGDRRALLKFFNDLSPESRHKRFLSLGDVSEKFVDALCQPAEPTQAVTLVVWRRVNDHAQPIAVASDTKISQARRRPRLRSMTGSRARGSARRC
jgi:hypothetical protein